METAAFATSRKPRHLRERVHYAGASDASLAHQYIKPNA
jgi:hypothetical protein